jgi:hypothetical protein
MAQRQQQALLNFPGKNEFLHPRVQIMAVSNMLTSSKNGNKKLTQCCFAVHI